MKNRILDIRFGERRNLFFTLPNVLKFIKKLIFVTKFHFVFLSFVWLTITSCDKDKNMELTPALFLS